jgi:hypothetical protein
MIRKFAFAARCVAALAAVAVVTSTAACNDDDSDVAGSRGALAVINVDAPSFAQSGVEFGVEIDAANVGINNVRDGRVVVTFESPMTARSVEASSGTTASISGGQVTWDLGTLDSNTRSRLDVRVVATLGGGEASRSARVRAELTARGISAGDAVATDFVTITP